MVSLETGNPETVDSLARETETGFDELAKLPARLERYSNAKERALINLTQVQKKINSFSSSDDVAYIRHLNVLAPKIAQCGDYLRFREYYTINKVRLSGAYFCKAHLLCPFCAIRRGSKLVEEYSKRHLQIMTEYVGIKTSMITITVKNGLDLAERQNHLQKSLQRLFKHRRKSKDGKSKTEFGKVIALVGTYEVTNKGNGWHPHAHIMVMHHLRIDAAKLKTEWFNITGDSSVLRIDPAKHPKDPAQDFLEIFKYAVKFGDLSPELNLQAYEVLRGKRLVFSAGEFRKVEINEDDLLDTPLEELPFYERLYKFVTGQGYTLAKTKHSDEIPDRETDKIDKKRVNQRDLDKWCGDMVKTAQKLQNGKKMAWNGELRPLEQPQKKKEPKVEPKSDWIYDRQTGVLTEKPRAVQ